MPPPPGDRMSKHGVYVASRASIPERAAMWRRLRDERGFAITASWIDEAGPGETASMSELWERIGDEIRRSQMLVLYAEHSDLPLKGALVEVGMAIALGLPVRIVAPNITAPEQLLGSWVSHPLVSKFWTVEDALQALPVEL